MEAISQFEVILMSTVLVIGWMALGVAISFFVITIKRAIFGSWGKYGP